MLSWCSEDSLDTLSTIEASLLDFIHHVHDAFTAPEAGVRSEGAQPCLS